MTSSSKIMNLGKYKGKDYTFDKILKIDPGYCVWILELEHPFEQMKDFAEYIKTVTTYKELSKLAEEDRISNYS